MVKPRYLGLLLLSLFSAASLFAQAPDTDVGFSYALLPRGNVTSILPDGSIAFPDTAVNLANPAQNQVSSATFTITNRGTRPVTVNNVIAGGEAFKISGVPPL